MPPKKNGFRVIDLVLALVALAIGMSSVIRLIHKVHVVFGPTPAATAVIASNFSPPDALADAPAISSTQKSVGYIECYWVNPVNGTSYLTKFGSGFMVLWQSEPVFVTSESVVRNDHYGEAQSCTIAFPDDNGVSYFINKTVGDVWFGSSYPNDPDEAAYISGMQNGISNVAPALTLDARAASDMFCAGEPASLGSTIAVVGYLGGGLTQTMSTGTVTGVDGDHLVTSIESDSSLLGGLSLYPKNNCIVGMFVPPSVNDTSTFGRIFPILYMFR